MAIKHYTHQAKYDLQNIKLIFFVPHSTFRQTGTNFVFFFWGRIILMKYNQSINQNESIPLGTLIYTFIINYFQRDKKIQSKKDKNSDNIGRVRKNAALKFYLLP